MKNFTTTLNTRRTTTVTAGVFALGLVLAGCSSDGDAEDAATAQAQDSATVESGTSDNAPEDVLDIEDGWVKATTESAETGDDESDTEEEHDHAEHEHDGHDHAEHDHADHDHGDGEMTSAFGVITNTGDEDLTIVEARAYVSDHVELHETADDGDGEATMREVDGGIELPAGESVTFEPGGYHFMLMDLNQDIEPGMTVDIEVEFDDGRSQLLPFTAKEFAGANESYGDIED